MERRQTSFVSKHKGVSKKIIIHDHSAYGKALEGKQVSRSKKSVIKELFPRMDPIWP
jgi:hypothetical protein